MDPLIICMALLVLPIFAYISISIKNAKYKKYEIRSHKSGCEVVNQILEEFGIDDVYVVEVPHSLHDSYDPARKTIKLRTEVFHGETVEAVSIAAHECVHAIQDKENNTLMKIRKVILPTLTLINKVGYITLLLGVLLKANDLLMLTIAILGVCLVFHVLTLPIEYEASNRAKELLEKLKIASQYNIEACESVLSTISLSYVASVLTSLFQIVFDLIDLKK